MKVKIKPWDEVVRLAKKNGDYDDNGFGGTVYYLAYWAAPWGEWVNGEFDIDGYFVVGDDEYPYYLKPYMIEHE